MTLLAEKLREAGIDTARAEVAAIVAKAVNRNGDDRIKAALEIGRALLDMRHLARAVSEILIDYFRSNADGGQAIRASDGPYGSTADHSSRDTGQKSYAAKAAARVPPRDETKRRAAVRLVHKVTAATVYDTINLRYGIDLRYVRVCDVAALAKKHRVVADLFVAMKRQYANLDSTVYIHEFFKADDIELFLKQAELANHE